MYFCWKNASRYTHIFLSKNISVYAIFNDSFNDTLINDIVCFEQSGLAFQIEKVKTALNRSSEIHSLLFQIPTTVST